MYTNMEDNQMDGNVLYMIIVLVPFAVSIFGYLVDVHHTGLLNSNKHRFISSEVLVQ